MRFFPITLLLLACGEGESFTNQDVSPDNQKSGYDSDGDGQSPAAGDCDDSDASIYEGAPEICDSIDNDCDCTSDSNGDGTECGSGDVGVDDLDTSGYVANLFAPDVDGDGANDDMPLQVACDVQSLEDFADYVGGDFNTDDWSQLDVDDYRDADGDGDEDDIAWDCDDADVDVYPTAPEVCDGQANDCDTADSWTTADEASMMSTFYVDADGDGYGDASSSYESCTLEAGYSADDSDCDDTDGSVNPAATEVCDGIDNNCGGDVDEGVMSTFYADADGDGQGDASVSVEACEASLGYVGNSTDCDDSDASIYLGASETCGNDGVDNDCDGDVSETPVDESTVYYDGDDDGYGDASDSFTSCTSPSGYVADDTDCDDTDPDVNPGVASDNGCDSIDNDCDGLTDEDPSVTTVTMVSDNGEPDSFTALAVSDDSSLEGLWYSSSTHGSAVAGVSATATHLGASAWELEFVMDLCLSSSGYAVIDSEFPDGTSLADDASASTHGDMDGTTLSFTKLDYDGDGDYEREITR